MAERYATIIKDNAGREVISGIALIEGKPADPSGGARIEKIGPGPKIGMIKGGKSEASGGWGFDLPAGEAKKPQDKQA